MGAMTLFARSALTILALLATPSLALAQPAQPTQADPAAAAASEAPAVTGAPLADPWEPFNRRVFAFNTVVDRAVLEPAARGYRALTPRIARQGVSNALSNLNQPVTVANALLQGDVGRAAQSAGRFGVNSTIGVLGIFDVATGMGLERRQEDFGQTLGVWGVQPGIYLMLPLIGPSTVRDVTGTVVDVGFQPMTYAQGEDATEGRIALGALGALSAREAAIEQIEALRSNSPDPYVTVRSIYGQARESAVRNGRQDVEALPDFGGPP